MVADRIEAKGDQAWSFILTVVWLGLAGVLTYILFSRQIDLTLNAWEFVILALAIFRMIRLVVFDSIAYWIRDFFFDKQYKKEKSGLYTVSRTQPPKGLRRKLCELVNCPWCSGVWVSLFVVFFYFLYPITWFFWVVLALAGVGTIVQLIAKYIDWGAKAKELEVLQ